MSVVNIDVGVVNIGVGVVNIGHRTALLVGIFLQYFCNRNLYGLIKYCPY